MHSSVLKLMLLLLIYGNEVNNEVSGYTTEKDLTYTPRELNALKEVTCLTSNDELFYML